MKDKLKEFFAILSPADFVYEGQLEEACVLIEDLEKAYTHYKVLALDIAIALADSIKQVEGLEEDVAAYRNLAHDKIIECSKLKEELRDLREDAAYRSRLGESAQKQTVDTNSKSSLAKVGVIASHGGIRVANPKKIVADGAKAMYNTFKRAIEIQSKGKKK